MDNENVFLLDALIMGIFITFVYDILRIFRRIAPHGSLLVSLEDIGFWIYCAAKVFLMMYHESNGTLRWFAVLGALVGMFAYKKLISPFFVKYVSLFLKKVFDVIGKVVGFLLKPFKLALRKMKKTTSAASAKMSRRKEHVKWLLKKKLTFLFKVIKLK